jgi:hypothetical protein
MQTNSESGIMGELLFLLVGQYIHQLRGEYPIFNCWSLEGYILSNSIFSSFTMVLIRSNETCGSGIS